jgi:hypothetical protein
LGYQIKEDELGGACSRNRDITNTYRILVGKSKGKRLGRPMCRWKDNIKMGTRFESVDCIHMVPGQGPVADSCEPVDESSGSINGWEMLH